MINYDDFATMSTQQLNQYFWDQVEENIEKLKNDMVRERIKKYVWTLKAQQDNSRLVEDGTGIAIADRIMTVREEEGDL